MTARVEAGGGMSGRETRAFRKDVRGGLAEAERRAYRARIAKLDAELAHVRAKGAERLKHQRQRCGAEYDEKRKQARTEIERVRAERDHKKTSCVIEAEHVKAQAAEEKRIVEAKLQAERDHRTELRRIEATNEARAKDHKKASGSERKAESDSDVEANLTPRQIAVFRKVKRTVKSSERSTRTEVFLKMIHDGGGIRALEAELGLDTGPSDRELARDQQKHETTRAAPARSKPSKTWIPF